MSILRLFSVAGALMLSASLFAAPLSLEKAVSFPDLSVAQKQVANVSLPPLPTQPGRLTVLSFRAVIVSAGPGGCNYNLAVQFNGQTPGRTTAAGTERLLGRSPTLELVQQRQGFPVFSGDKLMMMFAPDTAVGDTMTSDGLGATFVLDITDLARGVDGNTVAFTNLCPGEFPAGVGVLQVTNLTVGYVDKARLPKPVSLMPRRKPLSGGINVGGLQLRQSKRGGFTIKAGNGPELLVETGLGMKSDLQPVLVADDTASSAADVKVSTKASGRDGYAMTCVWPNLRLERLVRVQDGLVWWKETWTNTGSRLRGVPFRHFLFLRDQTTSFWVGGSSDNTFLSGSPCNPTLFMQVGTRGPGYGVTAESDWLRLLANWRGMSDLGEIGSDTLALEPGKSIQFVLSVTPVPAAGGYWSFINSLRSRWNMNRTTMQSAMFWDFAQPNDGTSEEKIKRALGHLGPITLALGPWQRLEPDARVVMAGAYPKLPADAPRTPGKCPDLDVNAFLTFAHREPYWQQLRQLTELIHKNAPNVKVIERIHPAMEAVYKPLQDRWPIAPDAIKTPDGSTFDDYGYSKAWLGDYVTKDWGVLYYAPHKNGPMLKMIMDNVRRGLDECKLDGIYSDEFSWAFISRGYSRYDYGRKDGYSADLDENGNVLRQKADNGMLTEAAQLEIAGELIKRGLFFLGNGGNVLQSLSKLPIQRFVEGGNGPSQWGQGHLSAVPLVLGNMGDETSLQGIFDSVRLCLQNGSIYSPMAVNLLLDGPDNFVCKQYPLTVQRLGPGYVIGKERVISVMSGTYEWPAATANAKLYVYDKAGMLITTASHTVKAGKAITLTVPEGGLVIAEKVP